MKLLALEMPEEQAALARWLEEQVVGVRLGDLVSQLACENGGGPPREPLSNLLGDTLPGVLDRGLSVCSEEQLYALLRHPGALLELQEEVFVAGGDYWGRVERTEEHRQTAEQVAAAAKHETNSLPAKPSNASRRRPRLAWFAIAAGLLLAVGLWETQRGGAPGWGFERSGLLAQELPAQQYLVALSDAASDWFNKQPQDAEQLATRLRSFREGCAALLAAPHTQLSQDDRTWLLERCGAWRDEIDTLLAGLDADPQRYRDIQQESDSLIRRLQGALRQRAQQLQNAAS